MRYNEIKEAKPKKSNLSAQDFLRRAGGFGYEVEQLPQHFWSEEEVYAFDAVFKVVHFEDGADEEEVIGRAYNDEEIVDIIKRHAKKHEPELLR